MCGVVEVIQKIGDDAPVCEKCGEGMVKLSSFPAMVKIKGEGGYPSRRKEFKGTSPYTAGYDHTKDKNSEFYRGER